MQKIVIQIIKIPAIGSLSYSRDFSILHRDFTYIIYTLSLDDLKKHRHSSFSEVAFPAFSRPLEYINTFV